jgi:hypothetical protein
VLVVHEGTGLGDHAKQRAERLASELGYVAYAMDLFGEPVADMAKATELMTGLFTDPANWRARLAAALDLLASDPRVDASKLAAVGSAALVRQSSFDQSSFEGLGCCWKIATFGAFRRHCLAASPPAFPALPAPPQLASARLSLPRCRFAAVGSLP